MVGLTGVSGSGKSTLLSILSGVLKDYKGEVSINGSRPDPKRQSIALVPQNYGLLPWKRVRDNILFPLTIGKEQTAGVTLEQLARRLQLDSLLDRFPAELSGGQKQRVALARAFLQSPDLLLMDEPFSALDINTAEKSRALFRSYQEELGMTTIIVSHNLQELEGLTNRVIVIGGAPGHIMADTVMPTADKIIKEVLKHEED